MLHFQRNYPHSTTASIPVSYPLSPSIECTQCAAILVACIPPFSRFFFPPVSGYFSFLLSFFFSSSSFALLPQTSPSPTGTHDSSVATHSQIVPASSLNFYDHGGVARTWSHLQIGFRFQLLLFFAFISLSVFGLGRDFFDPSMVEFIESLRTVESDNLSLLRFTFSSSRFSLNDKSIDIIAS